MHVPELTNFGSLLRHALDLEASTASFYDAASRVVTRSDAVSLLRELAKQHADRRLVLERTRQQKLNEMVLEPISTLDGSRYAFDPAVPDASRVGGKARELEALAARFYRDSLDVAKSLLTEAARTFRKLAEENDRNLSRLGVLLGDC